MFILLPFVIAEFKFKAGKYVVIERAYSDTKGSVCSIKLICAQLKPYICCLFNNKFSKGLLFFYIKKRPYWLHLLLFLLKKSRLKFIEQTLTGSSFFMLVCFIIEILVIKVFYILARSLLSFELKHKTLTKETFFLHGINIVGITLFLND